MLAGMINTDTVLVTQELLALLSGIDEFKGAGVLSVRSHRKV